jgi:hypothetical protein
MRLLSQEDAFGIYGEGVLGARLLGVEQPASRRRRLRLRPRPPGAVEFSPADLDQTGGSTQNCEGSGPSLPLFPVVGIIRSTQ